MFENLLSYLFTLFFVLNPHLVLPFFLACTQNYTNSERKLMGKKMCLFGLFFGLTFGILGHSILNLLEVTIPAFRMGGGLLLAVAAWGLLYSKTVIPERDPSIDSGSHADISLCPLAFPMFVGPATLTTIINMIQQAQSVGVIEQATVILALVILIGVTYICTLFGSSIVRLFGKNGLVILEKIGGILLIAMSIEMMAGGAKAYFLTTTPAAIEAQVVPVQK